MSQALKNLFRLLSGRRACGQTSLFATVQLLPLVDCAVANQQSRALRTLTLASTRHCVISFEKPSQLAGRPACVWQNEDNCDRSAPSRGDCAVANQHSGALRALTLASARQCVISCKKPVQLSQRPACEWQIELVCDRSAPARGDCAVANQLSRALRTLTLAGTRNCVISFEKPVQTAQRPACVWPNELVCDCSAPATRRLRGGQSAEPRSTHANACKYTSLCHKLRKTCSACWTAGVRVAERGCLRPISSCTWRLRRGQSAQPRSTRAGACKYTTVCHKLQKICSAFSAAGVRVAN